MHLSPRRYTNVRCVVSIHKPGSERLSVVVWALRSLPNSPHSSWEENKQTVGEMVGKYFQEFWIIFQFSCLHAPVCLLVPFPSQSVFVQANAGEWLFFPWTPGFTCKQRVFLTCEGTACHLFVTLESSNQGAEIGLSLIVNNQRPSQKAICLNNT